MLPLPLLLVLMLFGVFATVLLLKAVVVVPEQKAFVVERLGRFVAVLNPGFHILVPFIDVVRERHTLAEQTLTVPEQAVVTKDGRKIGVSAALRLRVVDPEHASYQVADYRAALKELAQQALLGAAAASPLRGDTQETLALGASCHAKLDAAASAWGVKIVAFEVASAAETKDRFGRAI